VSKFWYTDGASIGAPIASKINPYDFAQKYYLLQINFVLWEMIFRNASEQNTID